MKSQLPVSTLLSFAFLAAPAFAGDLIVEVNGIRSSEGRIYAGIHQRVPGVTFPDEAGSTYAFNVIARTSSVQVVFRGMPSGDYALTVYHDENSSGEIDRNAFGIPTEGYAFGNDATGFMGPPKFDDVAVTLAEGEASITASATMKY